MKESLASMLMGESPDMVALRALISKLAASHSSVLVTGESGTGKELVAKALHMLSPRARGPFVPINCGAIPRELIESELFGHRKGAFTGAVADRMGRFELAQGGTLFLDEIGDLPLDMQVKLLRVLQERCVLPVGATREVQIDVRVVAATHRKLEEEVAQGRFREDLYYRINVLPIFTTPLRERPADIQTLLLHHAKKIAIDGRRPIRFSAAMMLLLAAYAWPGNVRELFNLVDRFSTLFPEQEIEPHRIARSMLPPGLAQLQADLLAQSPPPLVLEQSEELAALLSVGAEPSITPLPEVPAPRWQRLAGAPDTDLAPTPTPRLDVLQASNDEMNRVEETILLAQGISTLPAEGISLKQHLMDIEKSLIEQALRLKDGNVSQTARILQLQRTTLIEKIIKYDLRAAE